MIGAGTSYNFIGGFGLPPDSTSRARCFDTVPYRKRRKGNSPQRHRDAEKSKDNERSSL
jgi:hypothetical protein